jgi:hypothetical protein
LDDADTAARNEEAASGVYAPGRCFASNNGEGKMKALLIAGMVAIGGMAAASAPAQAASVVIRTDNGWHHGHHWRHHWRHHERHCRVVVRRGWHHGHRVVRRVRICD